VYEWDGRDCLPGTDRPVAQGQCRLLCDLPPLNGAPEGIALPTETAEYYRFLIVADGLANGGCQEFRISR